MYEIGVISYFSAAHSLRNYKGRCENLHGHNWKVEVTASSASLNSQGMVMDFKNLKSIVGEVLANLDHEYLNDLSYFSAGNSSSSGEGGHNPSSEEIAGYIYGEVREKMPLKNCRLKEVRVWETERSYAAYSE